MRTGTLILLIIISISLAVGVNFFIEKSNAKLVIKNSQNATPKNQTSVTEKTASPESLPIPTSFEEIKPTSFAYSYPTNNQILKYPPTDLKISFKSPINDQSTIKVTKDNQPFSVRAATVTEGSLTLSVPFSNMSESGSFKVDYSVCAGGKPCAKGSFGFFIKKD